MVRIFPATETDDDFVLRLARQAGVTVHPQRERFLPQAWLLIAEIDQAGAPERVGFILGWLVADELEIIDLVVDPQRRRQGIGQQLLAHLMKETAERGATTVVLEVRQSNEAAQKLYKKLGFLEVGRRPRYYQGSEDALLFRCCLTERD
jgi:ribosomal-protein-alanine N-acetyltransferase